MSPVVTLSTGALRTLAQILSPTRLLLDAGEGLAYRYDKGRLTTLPEA